MKSVSGCNKINSVVKQPVFRLPSIDCADKERVKLGGQAPAFRETKIKDSGKVRLGGQGPIFRAG